jgi:hypothetical protein
MASVLKLVAGGVSSYTDPSFTEADFNSLASGSWIRSDADWDNSTNLDVALECSFEFTMGGTTASGAYLAFWALPLARTSAIYGDDQGEGSTLPSLRYLAATTGVKVGITSGNKIYGTFPRIYIERGIYRFGISQHTGVSFNSSAAAAVEVRTTNYNLNG